MIKYALIDGVRYPFNTDFKVAIECDKVLNKPDISDLDRAIDVVTLLLGEDVPFTNEALDKCVLFLQGGEKGDSKRLLDYEQHWDYFVGAFRQAYGINLNEVDMHYHEFTALLRAIKDTALNDIVELLTFDLSTIKDATERNKIIKAQEQFRVKEVKQEGDSEFLRKLAPSVRGLKE